MIYAIRAIGTDYIKFGKANNVGKRLAGHQVSCPHDLEIVAIAEWPDEAEKTIHALLAKHHHRGEWFKDSERTNTVITLMAKKGYGLRAIRNMLSKEQGKIETAWIGSSQGHFLAGACENNNRPILPEYQQVAIAACAAVMRENCGLAPKTENP